MQEGQRPPYRKALDAIALALAMASLVVEAHIRGYERGLKDGEGSNER